MGLLGPPKLMKNGFCSPTTLPGSTALPFVISTEAQRSGEISVWMLSLGNVFLADRSAVEGPAVISPAQYLRNRRALPCVSVS
jgi:hypothetical protein